MTTSLNSAPGESAFVTGLPDVAGTAVGRPTSLRAMIAPYLARGTLRGALAHGSFWSSVVTLCATGIGFGVQVLLARSLGADAYGAYTYALAWMNAALLLGKLESDTSSIRFVGAYAGTSSMGLLKGFLRRAHQAIGLTSAVAAIGLGLAVWLWKGHLDPRDVPPLWVACVLLPPTALLALKGGCLQGFHRVRASQVPNTILRPAVFGMAVFAFAHLAQTGLDARTAVFLQFGATGIALLVSSIALQRARPASLDVVQPLYEARLWTRTTAGLMLVAAANVIVGPQLDVLVVGSLLSTRQAGIYGVASQLATFAGLGTTAVVFAATPMIAALHARNNHDSIQRLLTAAVRGNYALTIPALPVVVLLGPVMLNWFGHPFLGGYSILLLLTTGMVVFAPVAMLAGYVMTMSGRQTHLAVILFCAVVTDVLALLVLAPRFGAMGVAMATFIAGAVKTASLAFYIRRQLRLSVLPFPRLRSIR